MTTHRYAVMMPGARLHYAVPAILARHRALQTLFTDIHGEHRWLRALDRLPARWKPKPLARLASRRLPPAIATAQVRESAWETLLSHGRAVASGQRIANDQAIERIDQAVIHAAITCNFDGASALYSCFINNDISAVQAAKRQGLQVVHELFIGADYRQILLDERRLFPGIETDEHSQADVDHHLAMTREKWNHCDKVLVPSPYVQASSVAIGCDPAKISIVPYGLDASWLELQPRPEQGRILCVGHVGLRKGNHYLAQACRLLEQRGVHFECRVAGPIQVDLSNPLFHSPTYLGIIPRNRIQEEFLAADLFVMPTLADSFGLVHLEAMACGVPVITTPHCGSVVRDGLEGFIVPIRDPLALADRIEQLLSNRPLRERMGAAARQRARHYTWTSYGSRLLEALDVDHHDLQASAVVAHP